MGHARCLLTLPDHLQKDLARTIISKGLSVRQAESLARRAQQEENTTHPSEVKQSQDLVKLQETLAEHVGVPIQIQCNSKGKGKLVLKYNNLDELDGILSHLGYQHEEQ